MVGHNVDRVLELTNDVVLVVVGSRQQRLPHLEGAVLGVLPRRFPAPLFDSYTADTNSDTEPGSRPCVHRGEALGGVTADDLPDLFERRPHILARLKSGPVTRPNKLTVTRDVDGSSRDRRP